MASRCPVWRLFWAALSPNTQPHSGQVYLWQGVPALFVRTEVRPGAGEPEHLLIVTRDRAVFEAWHPASDGLPEPFVLVHDPDASVRLERARVEFEEIAAERRGLVAAMKHAVALMPGRTEELRDAYKNARESR